MKRLKVVDRLVKFDKKILYTGDTESKEADIIFETEVEMPAVKQVESSAEKSTLKFKCEQCNYTNTTVKG